MAPSYKPVMAVMRALSVLSTVNRLDGAASVGAIHRETGVDKATIVRMLETLIHAGYVMREKGAAVYRITGKTLLLSSTFEDYKAACIVIEPHLENFCSTHGWPSYFGSLDGDAMLILEMSRRGGPLSFYREIGNRVPVLGAALGRAHLAYCSEQLREETRGLLVEDASPWNAVARDRAAFDALLEGVRRQGYADIAGEYARKTFTGKVSSIAVPIMRDGAIYGAVSTAYLTAEVSRTEAAASLLEPLRAMASKIACDLADKMAPTVEIAARDHQAQPA